MSDRRRMNANIVRDRRDYRDDRRTAPRYATQGTAAVIGWAVGEEHRTIPATLIDISMGGSSAWVESFPPPRGARLAPPRWREPVALDQGQRDRDDHEGLSLLDP